MNGNAYKAFVDAFFKENEDYLMQVMTDMMTKNDGIYSFNFHWKKKPKTFKYEETKEFAEVMATLKNKGFVRVRKSKVMHMLNLPPVSRQAGWLYVEEELKRIAERRLHGDPVG